MRDAGKQFGTFEFEVKILFPMQFEALRRQYCGTHTDWIKSILRTKPWETTGGKTKAEFFKSHDEKYVFKEVNQKEFKMFTEFGPLYFEYMAKVLYHNYPCCLAKILGAYVIKQKTQK